MRRSSFGFAGPIALALGLFGAAAAAAPKKKAPPEPSPAPAVEAEPPAAEPEPEVVAPAVPEAAETEPTPRAAVGSVDTAPPVARAWTLSMRVPWGRYERRRLVPAGGAVQLKTNVEAGPIMAPAVRMWTPLVDWLALGGELAGGFTSEDIDGGTTQKTSIFVELLAQLRVMPWQLAWGYPQLTLGVGGSFFDGRFVETNTSSGVLTALVPQGKAELGALVWLVPEVVGLDLAAGAGYAWGPGQLHVGSGQEIFLQRLTFELGAGLAATF